MCGSPALARGRTLETAERKTLRFQGEPEHDVLISATDQVWHVSTRVVFDSMKNHVCRWKEYREANVGSIYRSRQRVVEMKVDEVQRAGLTNTSAKSRVHLQRERILHFQGSTSTGEQMEGGLDVFFSKDHEFVLAAKSNAKTITEAYTTSNFFFEIK